jgi:hypothetical protein
MALGPTQPLTEISTRNLPGDRERPARNADNLTANCVENVGASTSHNHTGLHELEEELNFSLHSSLFFPNTSYSEYWCVTYPSKLVFGKVG